MEFSIGAVVFLRDGKYVPLMGDERIQMLRKFYRGEDLGDLAPYAYDGGGIRGPITWKNVRWDTAGKRVTGP